MTAGIVFTGSIATFNADFTFDLIYLRSKHLIANSNLPKLLCTIPKFVKELPSDARSRKCLEMEIPCS